MVYAMNIMGDHCKIAMGYTQFSECRHQYIKILILFKVQNT